MNNQFMSIKIYNGHLISPLIFQLIFSVFIKLIWKVNSNIEDRMNLSAAETAGYL
jgi:hypothetical protein